jgi:hypothetical protein
VPPCWIAHPGRERLVVTDIGHVFLAQVEEKLRSLCRFCEAVYELFKGYK